jgi:DNA-binding MarR family transcriptional regulator
MPPKKLPIPTAASADYQALAEFRFQIRRFLHFSEEAAKAEGLEPQQHQMMLVIRACNGDLGPTVGKLAEQLLIRHHSVVGLIDRLAERGMVERVRAGADRRQVRVRLTPAGEAALSRLSGTHREELRRTGPALQAALAKVLARSERRRGI